MTSTNTPSSPLCDLWRADPGDLVEGIRTRVRAHHRLAAEIGQLVAEVDNRGAKATFGYGSTLALLEDVTHLGYAAAKKFLDRARALNPSHQLDGTTIPARAPLTGAAAVAGAIGPGQIDAVVAVMSAIPVTVSQEDRHDAEKILVYLARDAGPREISRAGRRLLDTLDLDGPAPKDPDPPPLRRELHLQQHRDGTATLKATVDPLTYATIRAVIDPLAKPHPSTTAEGRDTRSHAERQGDALAEAFTLALAHPQVPTHAGDRAHLVLTLNYDDLRAGIGTACLEIGGNITATEARLLACDCRVIPAVLGTRGEPLDVGRAHRVVTPAQRRALNLRDGGCTFPGCDRPPRHCEAHHLREWVEGGETSLPNLALLCARHHRLVHFSAWEAQMTPDGTPQFIPPGYVDPLRQPRRNTPHMPPRPRRAWPRMTHQSGFGAEPLKRRRYHESCVDSTAWGAGLRRDPAPPCRGRPTH